MVKCYTCRTKAKHAFSECLSSTCTCLCVQAIYALPQNQSEEEVATDSPKFLKINNVEIKKLPDLAKAVSKFNKVDRAEWLPKKRDKRFTNKRKRYEHDHT